MSNIDLMTNVNRSLIVKTSSLIGLPLFVATWTCTAATTSEATCQKLSEVVGWYGGYTVSTRWSFSNPNEGLEGRGSQLDTSDSLYFDNPISLTSCTSLGSSGVFGGVTIKAASAKASTYSYLKDTVSEGCQGYYEELIDKAPLTSINCTDPITQRELCSANLIFSYSDQGVTSSLSRTGGWIPYNSTVKIHNPCGSGDSKSTSKKQLYPASGLMEGPVDRAVLTGSASGTVPVPGSSAQQASWSASWKLVPTEENVSKSCKVRGGSAISCEDQSLSEDVAIVGTPFSLHYQSDRVAGRIFSNPNALAQALGGWTLSDNHHYDPQAHVLYLGGGERRDRFQLDTNVKPSATGGYWIGSEDAGLVYEFAADGRHLKTLHALTGAALLTFAYDASGRLTGITDVDGNRTEIRWSTSGHPTAITGPYGQTTTLTVDANGYLASITNPAGETVKLKTSAKGLLTRFIDSKQQASLMSYDNQGRLKRDQDAAGGYQSLIRSGDAHNFTVTRTPAAGSAIDYRVSRGQNGFEHLNIRSQYTTKTHVCIDVGGTPFCFDIDERIQVASDRDRDGYGTSNPHGAFSKTLRDGMVAEYTLAVDPRFGRSAAFAKTASFTTPSGLKLAAEGARTASLTDPANPFSLKSLLEKSMVNGLATTWLYDGTSKTITQTSPAGRKAITTLNAKGRVVKQSLPGLYPVIYSYDAHGRLASIKSGSAKNLRITRLSYDNSGFLQNIVDAFGHTTSFTYDAAGRVTRQMQPNNNTLAFSYDANGNLLSLAPPGKPTHSFAYSPINLPISYTAPALDALPNTTSYAYDLDGKLLSLTRPDGKAVNFEYDPVGDLKTIMIGRGTYGYIHHKVVDLGGGQQTAEEAGHITAIEAPDGVKLAYDYDGGLLTEAKWSAPDLSAGSVQYAYDKSFRLKTVKVNGASPVSYRYDPDGLLIGAGLLALNRNTSNGLLTGSTLGKVSDEFTYNGFGEPTQYQVAYTGTPIYANTYAYDSLGRIAKRSETIGGATDQYVYAYDLVGHLTKVSKNGTVLARYTYDANGNRLSVAQPSGTLTSHYDAQDRLTKRGGTVYSYTANGELSGKSEGGNITAYRYDELGNLLQVDLPDGRQITYEVDGQNRRIVKKLNGTPVKRWLYQDQLKPVAELGATGAVVSRFVYASRDNVPDYMVKNGVTYRIVTDHLGSPRLVVNKANGSVAQRIDYDEFGNVLNDTNPGFQPFGFAGGIYDADTHLVRLGARDYDAESGRWTAKDPLFFYSNQTSFYVYADGDPINWRDQTGMDDTKAIAKDIAKGIWKGRTEESRTKELKKLDKGVGNSLKEYKKLIKEDEKTAKEGVNPLFNALTNLWNTCSNALAPEPSTKDSPTPKTPQTLPEFDNSQTESAGGY